MLLELDSLSAGYGEHAVLRGVSLAVDRGESVAIIGPNGAGKSTVLKAVVGLAAKTAGRVRWKGRDITALKTHRLLAAGVSFVPQGRLVFPSLTVRENLAMGGYLIDRRETLRENLDAVLALFPVLRRKARALAGSLSGGEQQMLAIGRALVVPPELLMLDEPSLGLSPKVAAEVYGKLGEICEAGTTLLIVEQNVRLVLRSVQRGYLLVNGEVRASGPAAALGDERLMHEAYLV